MNAWQRIESAPKDGTEFLAFSPCGPESSTHSTYFDGIPRMWVRYYSLEYGWRDIFPASFGPTPTHWMPLPDPPVHDSLAERPGTDKKGP